MINSVSFVVPCYNEEKLLRNCLLSIMAEAVTIEHSEILVVDNGSTDDSAAIAHELGCTVVFEKEKGVTRARATGALVAEHEVIAFIDADNMLPKGWLAAALNALSGPNVVAASGPVVYYDMVVSRRIVSYVFYILAKASHQLLPMLQGGNFILRKKALTDAGGFDTNIDFYGEDTSTAMRLSEVGKVNFDLNMYLLSSARRLQEEGMVKTGARYIANYLWMHFKGKPFTSRYNDIRPS